MKRKDFFKRLGIGVVAAVIAPKVIAQALEEQKVIEAMSGAKSAGSLMEKMKPYQDEIHKGWARLNDPNLLKGTSEEWYEEPRQHFKHLAKIIDDTDGTIEVSVSADFNLRLFDLVMMNDQSFLVSSFGNEGFHEPLDLLKYYDITGNVLINGSSTQHIVLTPYNKPEKPYKIGDEYLMMLVRSNYIPGSDNG